MAFYIVPCSYSVNVDVYVEADSEKDAQLKAECQAIVSVETDKKFVTNCVNAKSVTKVLGYCDDSFITAVTEVIEEISEEEFNSEFL